MGIQWDNSQKKDTVIIHLVAFFENSLRLRQEAYLRIPDGTKEGNRNSCASLALLDLTTMNRDHEQ